jgi:hypothetical protein
MTAGTHGKGCRIIDRGLEAGADFGPAARGAAEKGGRMD